MFGYSCTYKLLFYLEKSSPSLTLLKKETLRCVNDDQVSYVNGTPDEELKSIARATKCIPDIFAKFSFDVEILNGGDDDNIVIGLASDISDRSPGMHPNTIGIYGFDGSIIRNGKEASSASPFTTGDKISCKVDRTKISNSDFTITSCQFVKNGLIMSPSLNVGGKKHYPAVGLHSPGAEVRIKFNLIKKPGKFLVYKEG